MEIIMDYANFPPFIKASLCPGDEVLRLQVLIPASVLQGTATPRGSASRSMALRSTEHTCGSPVSSSRSGRPPGRGPRAAAFLPQAGAAQAQSLSLL